MDISGKRKNDMKLNDVIKKAKYIQFPYLNKKYHNLYGDRNPVLLPIVKNKEVLYTGMPDNNSHHYTTWYAYNIVLPIIAQLLNFQYSLDDFKLIETYKGDWDLSYIKPKKNYKFSIINFETNKSFTGDYMVLFNPDFKSILTYRKLYRFPHTCSRIINHTIKSDRKLMISGDSQMIPLIAPLACYFNEVWYFNNRTGWIKDPEKHNHIFDKDKFKSFSNTYQFVEFTDVLIECYCSDLNRYECWNLQ